MWKWPLAGGAIALDMVLSGISGQLETYLNMSVGFKMPFDMEMLVPLLLGLIPVVIIFMGGVLAMIVVWRRLQNKGLSAQVGEIV